MMSHTWRCSEEFQSSDGLGRSLFFDLAVADRVLAAKHEIRGRTVGSCVAFLEFQVSLVCLWIYL
jgi:hypothetical protein